MDVVEFGEKKDRNRRSLGELVYFEVFEHLKDFLFALAFQPCLELIVYGVNLGPEVYHVLLFFPFSKTVEKV